MNNDRKFVDGIANKDSDNITTKPVDSQVRKITYVPGVEFSLKGFYKKPFFVLVLSVFVIAFLWFSIGNLLNIKNNIVQAAVAGVENLKVGVESLKKEDYAAAAEQFAMANRDFVSIEKNLTKLGHDNYFLGQSLPSDQYDEVVEIIDALEAMTRGAKFLALAMQEIKDYSGNDFSGLLFDVISDGENNDDVFTLLDRVSEYVTLSSEELTYSIAVFEGIDENLIPADYVSMYEVARKDAPRYLNLLQGINSFFTNAENLLGKDVPATYMLLFQNYNEIRPTGGFIGSYGIATFSEGKMTDVYFDDIYNPDGQILEEIDPPYPINMMTKEWGMRDSNWYPDFPTSADNIVRMYEKEGGYTVDGVIAFTPEVVNRLLDLTGSVKMEDYGVTLNSDNFAEVVQRKVELEYDKEENKPKKILDDLMPILIERMQNLPEEQKKDFWQMVLDLMYERHIMVFVYDEDVEYLIDEMGWAGSLVETGETEDYLSMVHANIGGRKSDLYIKEAVRHEVEIMPDGSVVVDLTITRRNVEDWTWPNYSNYDYLRVYVPQGSELLAVDGFKNAEGMVIGDDGVLTYDQSYKEAGLANTKVYDESDKTVFANWIVTDPWDVSVASYKYLLPFKIDDSYQLYVQKQSGRRGIDYVFKINSGDRDVINVTKEAIKEGGVMVFKGDLVRDFEVEVLY